MDALVLSTIAGIRWAGVLQSCMPSFGPFCRKMPLLGLSHVRYRLGGPDMHGTSGVCRTMSRHIPFVLFYVTGLV